MRNAIVQPPQTRTGKDQQQVFRAAIRQLDRAELYLVAVDNMQLDDRAAERLLNHLRTDLASLRRYLGTRRRDVRPLHPDVDPTPTTIENKMSDFRPVGGLLYSFASTDTDLATGKVLERTTVRSITLNPAFDPKAFEKL